MEALYLATCRGYFRDPNDEQFAAWQRVLGEFPVSEVEAALAAWRADTRPDDRDGRPRGSHFPQPTDLKAQLQLARKVRTSQGGRVRCGSANCEDGW